MTPTPASAPPWLACLPDARLVSGAPFPVSDVCYDSRRVTRGALFVAMPGMNADGHQFLREAVDRGAVALLVQEDRRPLWKTVLQEGRGVAVVSVDDTRASLARIAAAQHGEPGRKLGVIGVTGTDGKTTTAHLIAHVLQACDVPAGLLSSAALRTAGDDVINASHMTTLEAPEVQASLAAMVDVGKRFAVLEASSHGLALHRVDACFFDVGVFTTLSPDHLDFHHTMDAYRAAKGLLFEMVEQTPRKEGVAKAAVVNADDPAGEYFRRLTSAPAFVYGVGRHAVVRAESLAIEQGTLRFRIFTANGFQDVRTSMVGTFNVYNCLAAACVGLSQGLTLRQVARALESFPGVPGRMERIDAGQPFAAVVDIASTPQAMRRVLEALRPSTPGRLIAVFGAAGERDPARREGMGAAAAELADYVVLTNEDPRREDPDAIIEAIARPLHQAGRREGDDFVRVPDRREALRHAFARAREGDTVLLAGKGSEQSMVFGTEHVPWDERVVARELLEEMRGAGP